MTDEQQQSLIEALEKQRNNALAAVANLELRIELLVGEANSRIAALEQHLRLVSEGLV